MDWTDYLQASKDKPLHLLWREVEPYLEEGQVALELGCGAGAGVEFLASKGLQIIAVDQEPEALELTKARLKPNHEVHLVRAQFQDLGLDANSLDIIYAGFSLFFLRAWEFGQVWQRLLKALKEGGIFAGQLLGVNDDWAERGYTVHTLNEVQSLLHPFEILYFEEAERDGKTMVGTEKHWHVFHIVARKRAVEGSDA